jgi:hypothetical protein
MDKDEAELLYAIEDGARLFEISNDEDSSNEEADNYVSKAQKSESEASESSYQASGEHSDDSISTTEDDEVPVVKATTKRGRSRDSNVIIEGCNVKPLSKMKPSTVYCYMNNFHNFWKWLYDHHENVVRYNPPARCPRTFDEMKAYTNCPIKMDKLTPEIFFEYVGTNDVSKYKPLVSMVRQVLKHIAEIFNLEKIYIKFMMDTKSKEITTAVGKKFDRGRFVAEDTVGASAKRPRTIIEDDPSVSIEDLNFQRILYLKRLAYHQWEVLEAMTPGIV